MVVYFFDHRKEYGYLSNSSPHSFELDGHVWRTNEHFYHAQRFYAYNDKAYQMVHAMDTPRAAKNMAHSYNARPDWGEIKDDVMRRGVLAKFTQNPELTDFLLSTGKDILIEDSPYDAYWGRGLKGDGLNMLGRILMEARTVIGASQFVGNDAFFLYAAREFSLPRQRGVVLRRP